MASTEGGREALFAVDSSGEVVEVLEGDTVRSAANQGSKNAGASGQRMVVVGVEGVRNLVVLRAENTEEGGEVRVAPDQLILVCEEGVTRARAQMRQLLTVYFQHCKRLPCVPHEGLVQGIEYSIRTAHVGYAQGCVCLDLAGRSLRDAELIDLNSAFVQWHLANDTCSTTDGAAATAADTSAHGDATASATCMRLVQCSYSWRM